MSDADDRFVRAGEYVLGTLSPDERAAVERELARDFELRRAVYYWQDRLFAMTRVPDPEEPSGAVWTRIERTLRPAPPAKTWWENVVVWRTASVAALALAVALGIRVLAPSAPAERYVAVLENDQKTAGWIVEVEARGSIRLVPLGRTEVPPQRALQFWTKAPSEAAPTSLGLVPGDRPTVVSADRLRALEPNQLFELTLEPAGGSPIGRPTGPVLFIGRAVAMK